MRYYLILLLFAIGCSTATESEKENRKKYTTYFETTGDFEKLFDIKNFTSDSIFTLSNRFEHRYNYPSDNTGHLVHFYVSIPPHNESPFDEYRLAISLGNEFLKDNSYEVYDINDTSSEEASNTGKIIASLHRANGRNLAGHAITTIYTSQSGKLNVIEMENGNIRGEFDIKMRLSEKSEVRDFIPVENALTIKGSFQTILE